MKKPTGKKPSEMDIPELKSEMKKISAEVKAGKRTDVEAGALRGALRNMIDLKKLAAEENQLEALKAKRKQP